MTTFLVKIYREYIWEGGHLYIMKAILERRSIRKYTEQQVGDEVVKDLLRAAMSAPSAGNERPWHFIVIRNKEILQEIPKFHPHAQMLKQAPLAILICGDLSLEKYEGYWVQDCAAATENILITVQEKGLGAVWLGIYPDSDRVEPMKKIMSLPENIIPFSLISIGFPAEKREVDDRFDETRIHYDRW